MIVPSWYQWARHEIGAQEIPGPVHEKRVLEYWALGKVPLDVRDDEVPWCAAFVCWCVRQWVNQIGPKDPIYGKWAAAAWRPQTAGAFDLENWAKERKLAVLGPKAEARPGDIVVFDMSHCGIVVGDHPANSLFIDTVEGNTGSQSQRDGDGVWRKKRSRVMVRSIIRVKA